MVKVLLSFICLMTVAAGAQAAPDPLPSWLAGGWEKQGGQSWGDEYWTPPRGGIMIGSGRVGRDDKLSSFESMRIGYDEEGKLAFWAFPQWKETAKFLMAKQTEGEIVFENAAHDYPQRVRYWREGKLLKAEISLIDGTNAIRFDFKPVGNQ